ncbi:hypothetical protein THMIRHAM_09280 [Thiomicrorhabdus immobilis]|uniref:Uncharacterized protein n=1 Tax=Thiomicrorhabdus immobilis TaxID=2791037 RepID=A0ABN6CVT2_9GAMM|nr:hypothetical protein [Thiomicrorhabdus immobilis]BCN93143.1 hypothetical protein THMIRHAM_09280 [Thiomicrorhabdus immobilis]
MIVSYGSLKNDHKWKTYEIVTNYLESKGYKINEKSSEKTESTAKNRLITLFIELKKQNRAKFDMEQISLSELLASSQQLLSARVREVSDQHAM